LTKTLLVSFLKPIKKYWPPFGSRVARLVDKTDSPRQCETCWDYHSSVSATDSLLADAVAGPATHQLIALHQNDVSTALVPTAPTFTRCPARPRKVHGVFRRLTKEQREHVRTAGAEIYRQHNLEPQSELQSLAAELQRGNTVNGIE
jgi:hypothetical protein